jgi:prevent-host-death family protein
MEDAHTLVYTMRDLNQRTAEIIRAIREAGRPAFITSHGRFIAVIQPLEPGQVEQQALAAISREFRDARETGTANREISTALNTTPETTETTGEAK